MNFHSVIQSHPLVLIDFYANWCEPCKWLEPILAEVEKNLSGKIFIHKIDIDASPDTARANHVLSVPTLALFKNGKEVWRMRGFETAPVLIKIISDHVSS